MVCIKKKLQCQCFYFILFWYYLPTEVHLGNTRSQFSCCHDLFPSKSPETRRPNFPLISPSQLCIHKIRHFYWFLGGVYGCGGAVRVATMSRVQRKVAGLQRRKYEPAGGGRQDCGYKLSGNGQPSILLELFYLGRSSRYLWAKEVSTGFRVSRL